MGQKMKKSLTVLILLSGLLGCDKSPSSIAVQNEPGEAQIQDSVGNPEAVDTETTAERLSNLLGASSLESIIGASEMTLETEGTEKPEDIAQVTETEKPEERVETEKPEASEPLTETPVLYISKKDGFRVLMPSDPKVMTLDPTNNIHVRIYQTQIQGGLVQYNVFSHLFKKKILQDESIRTFLDSYLPDRLVGVDDGQIVRKEITKFRGFDAKVFEYNRIEGDAEFIYQGIVFLIDGDSISLTMVSPKESMPELTFDKFTESFELLPLEPLLSPNEWEDKRSGLKFTPPIDMTIENRERDSNGLIVTFVNQAEHTIGILDATVAYPGITWSDIELKLSEMRDCGDGFFEKTIAKTSTHPPMVQLLKCARKGEKIYLIQAYAPQKSYFRSVRKFKAAMKTLTFDE